MSRHLLGVAMPDPLFGNGNDELLNDDEHERELENDNDVHEDAAALFDIDVGDSPIDVNAVDGDGGEGTAMAAGTGTGSTSTHGTSNAGTVKRKSGVWVDFHEIKEGDVRIAAICKMCGTRMSARSAAGTGHLIRHHNSCRKKKDHAHRVQSMILLLLVLNYVV
jgi:hypothetical protein